MPPTYCVASIRSTTDRFSWFAERKLRPAHQLNREFPFKVLANSRTTERGWTKQVEPSWIGASVQSQMSPGGSGGGINDDALQRRSGIVPRTTCDLSAAPRGPGHAFPIRIEQYLIGVKTRPSRRIDRSGDPVGIDLARRDARHKDMPIVV